MDTGYQRVHWRWRWQLARAFRNVSEHFEAFRTDPLPLPLVAFCCGLTWTASVDRRTETKVGPAGGRSPPDADGSARQMLPPLIRMAARCAHAGPTSRHTRQSRLPDREAARGRTAVVTKITAALMLGFIRLYCGPCHDLSLAWHLQCVWCDKKILWPSVGLSLGLIGTCWYFFGLIGSRWYVVAFGGNGHQTDHRGLRRFTPG